MAKNPEDLPSNRTYTDDSGKLRAYKFGYTDTSRIAPGSYNQDPGGANTYEEDEKLAAKAKGGKR